MERLIAAMQAIKEERLQQQQAIRVIDGQLGDAGE